MAIRRSDSEACLYWGPDLSSLHLDWPWVRGHCPRGVFKMCQAADPNIVCAGD